MTKTNSTNYTASGTQFPLANDPLDTLADEDIYTLQRAVNEHTHDDTRGLAVRRINTSAAPGAAGQVRINGDLFQWWADTSDVILTAASTGLVQTWTAQQRLNEPVLMPDVSTPSAPGASLNLLYFKGGLLYRRSGAAGGETPVGTPPAAPIVAKMFDTDGTAGWAELRQVTLASASFKDWVLTFDQSTLEVADFAFPIPPGYAGTPITFYVHWMTTATSGNVVFRVDGLVSTTGGSLTTTASTVASGLAFAAQGVASRKALSTLPWTAALPVANDWLQCRFTRIADNVADTLAADVDVLGVTVAFG